MSMTKLTLSADEKIISLAKKQAEEDNISLSAMFASYILSRARNKGVFPENGIGPLARKALEIGKKSRKVQSGESDRDLTRKALTKKYGLNK